MADDGTTLLLRHQRDGERTGPSQRVDDEVLRLFAVRHGAECISNQRSDRDDVARGLPPQNWSIWG